MKNLMKMKLKPFPGEFPTDADKTKAVNIPRLMRHIETNYKGQSVNSDLGHEQNVTTAEVRK